MSTSDVTALHLALNSWVYDEAPAIRAALNFLESAKGRRLTEVEVVATLRGFEPQCSDQTPSLCSLLLQLSEGASHD